MSNITVHYNELYFGWQKSIGQFGAKTNLYKFQPYVRPTDRVVDFGCGGGYLLAALQCGERRGVEINPVARVQAVENGITCVSATEELGDEWADVIISNSVLEHVEHPAAELRQLLSKLRRGGRIVFCVPHETTGARYVPNDINQHLYTWSPLNLGNLFTRAGFEVETVTVDRSMWPPQYERLYDTVGHKTFMLLCRAYRNLRMALYALKPVDSHSSNIIVARRP